jgi:hypothetical protein
MTNIGMNRKRIVLQLSRMALLVYLLVMTPGVARAQNADVGLPVQPSSQVRLTGVLEPAPAHALEFPRINVWIGGTPWLFRVCQIEPLIPAYPAEEELRKISGSGLRLVTDSAELATLQKAETHERPVVIEGQLRVRAGLLRVNAARTTELTAGQCPTDRTAG